MTKEPIIDSSLLTLGLLAGGGYLLYKMSGGISKVGGGLGDVAAGAGTAATGLGSGVGQAGLAAGQFIDTSLRGLGADITAATTSWQKFLDIFGNVADIPNKALDYVESLIPIPKKSTSSSGGGSGSASPFFFAPKVTTPVVVASVEAAKAIIPSINQSAAAYSIFGVPVAASSSVAAVKVSPGSSGSSGCCSSSASKVSTSSATKAATGTTSTAKSTNYVSKYTPSGTSVGGGWSVK